MEETGGGEPKCTDQMQLLQDMLGKDGKNSVGDVHRVICQEWPNETSLTTATLLPRLSPSPDSYLLLGRLDTHPVHRGVLRPEAPTLSRRPVHTCGTEGNREWLDPASK